MNTTDPSMNRRQALQTMGATALGLAAGGRGDGAHLPSDASDTGRAPEQEAGEILIRGGRVVNADATSQSTDVRILGNTIAEVGPGLTAGAEARIIDA